jgi:hypothetical protein
LPIQTTNFTTLNVFANHIKQPIINAISLAPFLGRSNGSRGSIRKLLKDRCVLPEFFYKRRIHSPFVENRGS